MRIILSPAKKMNEDLDCPLAPSSLPEYLEQTEEILAWLKGKSHEELKALWACNDKIAEQKFRRAQDSGSAGNAYDSKCAVIS